MKTDDRKEFRGYGLMNICFKDFVKLLQSQEKHEIQAVLHDCFHFLTSTLLATSSDAFFLVPQKYALSLRFFMSFPLLLVRLTAFRTSVKE